jgi:hypothetical protein
MVLEYWGTYECVDVGLEGGEMVEQNKSGVSPCATNHNSYLYIIGYKLYSLPLDV